MIKSDIMDDSPVFVALARAFFGIFVRLAVALVVGLILRYLLAMLIANIVAFFFLPQNL